MVEATAQTTTSTTGIWVIVVVAVVALGFWLTAVSLADRSQVRASRRARVSGGAWAGGSVPAQAEEMPASAAREPVGGPGQPARDESVPEGEVPTRADLPAQPAAPQPAAPQPTLPPQRTGEADRAARSNAGPAGDESGR